MDDSHLRFAIADLRLKDGTMRFTSSNRKSQI